MTLLQTKNKNGFTLIELLIVVAIIGMLVSVVLVSFTNARRRSRDAKRISDMRQLKLGLDIYFSSGAGFPVTAAWVPGADLYCNDSFVFKIPQDLLTGTPYLYTAGGYSGPGCSGTVMSTYKIQFTTEADSDIGPAGTYYLHPGGITPTAPF